MQKRKTLVNALSNSNIVDKNILEQILLDLNIDLRVRAEQLTLEDFSKIADKIKKDV